MPRSVIVIAPLAFASTASTISPVYYLSFAVVVAALILVPLTTGGAEESLLDRARSTDRTPSWWGWLVCVAVVLSLAPLPFGGRTAPDGLGWTHSFILRHVGVLWLVVILAAIAWMVTRIVSTRRAHGAGAAIDEHATLPSAR